MTAAQLVVAGRLERQLGAQQIVSVLRDKLCGPHLCRAGADRAV